MSIATEATETLPKDVVLSLTNVSCTETSSEAIQLREINLEVRQGDLVMIHLGRRQNPRVFSSMVQGLTFPLKGQIAFQQRCWNDASVEQQFLMRSQIGRVFDGRAWINNLNIIENVTLRVKHHAFPAAKLQQQIKYWSKQLEVPSLSRERPAFVEASRLQRYQWLRALIGDPALLILERPMRTLDPEMITPLVTSINQIREQKAAVIWFTGSDYEMKQNFTGTVRHYQLKDGKLIPSSEENSFDRPHRRNSK
jgi:phospholipid/cholesterol/gamma-HCH transport system ATP-binding protein